MDTSAHVSIDVNKENFDEASTMMEHSFISKENICQSPPSNLNKKLERKSDAEDENLANNAGCQRPKEDILINNSSHNESSSPDDGVSGLKIQSTKKGHEQGTYTKELTFESKKDSNFDCSTENSIAQVVENKDDEVSIERENIPSNITHGDSSPISIPKLEGLRLVYK